MEYINELSKTDQQIQDLLEKDDGGPVLSLIHI